MFFFGRLPLSFLDAPFRPCRRSTTRSSGRSGRRRRRRRRKRNGRRKYRDQSRLFIRINWFFFILLTYKFSDTNQSFWYPPPTSHLATALDSGQLLHKGVFWRFILHQTLTGSLPSNHVETGLNLLYVEGRRTSYVRWGGGWPTDGSAKRTTN